MPAYQIDLQQTALNDSASTSLAAALCSLAPFSPLLDNEAVVRITVRQTKAELSVPANKPHYAILVVGNQHNALLLSRMLKCDNKHAFKHTNRATLQNHAWREQLRVHAQKSPRNASS